MAEVSDEGHDGIASRLWSSRRRPDLLEYHVKPDDKEPMHSHPAAVVYVLSDGKAKATTPNGKSQIVESKAGQTLWSEPATHSWEYIGPGPGRVLIVEMKNPPAARPAARKTP